MDSTPALKYDNLHAWHRSGVTDHRVFRLSEDLRTAAGWFVRVPSLRDRGPPDGPSGPVWTQAIHRLDAWATGLPGCSGRDRCDLSRLPQRMTRGLPGPVPDQDGRNLFLPTKGNIEEFSGASHACEAPLTAVQAGQVRYLGARRLDRPLRADRRRRRYAASARSGRGGALLPAGSCSARADRRSRSRLRRPRVSSSTWRR